MNKLIFTSLALAAVGSFLVVSSAFAMPIKGGIYMPGKYNPIDLDYKPGSLESSTGIEFGAVYVVATNGDNKFIETTPTGDFLDRADTVWDIIDFHFPDFSPVTPLWSVGGFSLAMTSRTYDKSLSDVSYLINIYGTGTVSSAGYYDTMGIFNFTAQGVGDANFSWSASAATSPIPEPATMLLFGTGLAGLAGVFRRKKKD
jgi:hypothetical protein